MRNGYRTSTVAGARGALAVLAEDYVDTDRILPARFLLAPGFEHLRNGVFADDAKLRDDHPFHDRSTPRVLVVGEGFGCGSSREHAPRALQQAGVRALIGGSFAEIFHANALAVGLACATARRSDRQQLAAHAEQQATLDVAAGHVSVGTWRCSVSFGAGVQRALLDGSWDALTNLLAAAPAVRALAAGRSAPQAS